MSDAPVVQAHDDPVVFSFPELHEQINDKAREAFVGAATVDSSASFAQAAPPADTLGWDTVFAIRATDVNKAIVKQKTTPPTFDSGDLGGGWSIKGNFNDWQITTGGDGENLNVLVPASSGNMIFGGKTYSLAGAVVTAQYKLELIPGNPPPTAPTKSGSNHKFKPKTTAENANDPIVAAIQVTVPAATQQTWPAGMAPSAVIALIQGAFGTFLSNTVQDFTQTFAAVDLNVMADQGSLQWLKPAYTSYAFADGTSLENSFFGVLTLTSDISRAENLKHELAPSAIPTNQRSAFLISQQLFMQQAILPGLPHAFKSASASDFKLINNDTEVVNTTKDTVQLDSVKYGAIEYHPYLDSFDLVIDTAEFVTTLTAKVQISPGIVTYIDITTYHGLKLEQKTNGKQTIGFSETRPYKSSHRVHTAPGVIITEVIASLIVAVVGAVVGKMAETIAKRIVIAIIVAIIAGIITGIQLIITEVIAKGVAESMPEIDPLVQTGTDPITWPTQTSNFTITAVGLNMSVQLSGDPGFAD